ncbi:MAG: Si-specific NAD(P)(+) transhydrogenase [Candidatus Eisenbacteria bacterium]|nr:Si-specific NAD(P)(+) transhydrogenase [Candidatus Eisenbacteria bacterium]
MLEFDLLVIGTGPAGQRAAVQASKLGHSVAVVERREAVGGVCLNTGTVPSKTLREAVLYLTGHQQRGMYGDSHRVKQNITAQDLHRRTDCVVQREMQVIRSQMQRNGIAVLTGTATFVDPHTLVVRGEGEPLRVSAERIVIAVGTRPAVPDSIPTDGEVILDTDQVLRLRDIPRTLTVVGGGVIGTEYASMFAVLGTRVTLVDKRPRLMEFLDSEIVDDLVFQLRDMGVVFRLGEDVSSIEMDGDGRAVARLGSGKVITSQALLYSAGRAGATEDLNLDAAGLEADGRGRIKVDGQFRTAVAHIYAAGDVIGFPSLASTSAEQGRLAACHALGIASGMVPVLFPYGIYSIPEISFVGRSEDELTRDGVPYEVGVARYREIARGQILGDENGLVKLLFHRESRALLGAHAIGTGATELIHIAQAVMAFGGGLEFFLANVFNYPTLAECYKVAALDCMNKLGVAPGSVALPRAA